MKTYSTFAVIYIVLNVLVASGQEHTDSCNETLINRDIPQGYYDAAIGKTGAELKTALYNIIKGHTAISYTGLWTAFQTTDKRPDGKVWDMYSNCVFTFGSDQCGNYSGECDCYNREHSMPKSWFNEGTPMYSDLFHLVPTDGYVNGRRSNYPFGEVTNPTYTSGNGSKLGPCSFPGYTGVVFEPVDDYKGDFARGYLYMATRYENVIASWENYDQNGNAMLDGTSYPAYEPWAVNLLLAWHQQDPVSAKEIARNNAVYVLQHNRNPYIDHPEYANQVWNPGSCTTPTQQAVNFQVVSLTTNSCTISWTRGNGDAVLVVASQHTFVAAEPVNGTQYTANPVFGSGQQLASGLFAVYSGNGNSTTITGLQPYTSVYFTLYEFNNTGFCYLKPGYQNSTTTSPSISVTQQPQNMTTCEGTSAVFSVIAQGEGTLAYQWFFENNPLANETSNLLQVNNCSSTNQGNYYCAVQDNFMTLNSALAHLSVENQPFAGNDTTISVMDTLESINLNTLLTPGATFAGVWTDINFNVIPNPFFSPSASGEGQYTFYHLVDINSCPPDTAEVMIHVEHYVGIPANQGSKVQVFPNPFSNSINIVSEKQAGVITIRSVTGQILFQHYFSGNTSIDASRFEQGVYLISVKTNQLFINKCMIKR